MEETRLGGDDEDGRLQLLSRDELEERVRDRTAALENLMDTMVDVLLKLDPEGRIEMANEAVYEILGYEEGEVTGKPVDYVFAPAAKNEQLSDMMTHGQVLDRLVTQGHIKDVEIYFEAADGETIPMSLSASVMEDEGGQLSGIVCVAKDISERKAAEEKAEFLHSLLRHDLSNKLQVIEGNLGMVDPADLEGEYADFFEYAHEGIADAIELIDNVRTLHKLEGEEELVPVSLGEVVTDAVSRHEDLQAAEGFEVEVDLEQPVDVLAGSLLKELFSNLVENALRHSGGSLVRVEATVEGDAVEVTVADDGRGIPEEKRDRVTEKGYSGTGSAGSGLGVYLAKEIAETYEGEFSVGEADLGGAQFSVRLRRHRH